MKPSIPFLLKVQQGRVMHVAGYKPRTGGYTRFYGGESAAKKHEAAGFIVMRGAPRIGTPVIAELTDAGRAALASEASRDRL